MKHSPAPSLTKLNVSAIFRVSYGEYLIFGVEGSLILGRRDHIEVIAALNFIHPPQLSTKKTSATYKVFHKMSILRSQMGGALIRIVGGGSGHILALGLDGLGCLVLLVYRFPQALDRVIS